MFIFQKLKYIREYTFIFISLLKMFPYLLHGFYNGAVLGCESLKTGKNTHSKCEYFQPQREYIKRDLNVSAIVLFLATTSVSAPPLGTQSQWLPPSSLPFFWSFFSPFSSRYGLPILAPQGQ
jgi:hypothetical protein